MPEALQLAREFDLDLVEVAPNAEPPVCRLMNYSKHKYEQDMQRKESRRRTSNVVVKEMKFRPKIDEHDYSTKTKHVERFLNEGFKVKVTIMFRGRELAHPELGMKILERIAEQVADEGVVEVTPKIDGRNMTMVIAPTKRKVKTTARSDEGDHGASVAIEIEEGPQGPVSGDGAVRPPDPAVPAVAGDPAASS